MRTVSSVPGEFVKGKHHLYISRSVQFLPSRSNHGRRLLSRAVGRTPRRVCGRNQASARIAYCPHPRRLPRRCLAALICRARRMAEEIAVNPTSALTRRSVALHHRIVNSAPAQCCVWPVVAPAQAFVRAGAVLRGAAALLRRSGVDALSEALSGTPGQSSPMGKLSPAGILLSVRVCTGDWAASRVPIGMSRVHLKPVARFHRNVARSYRNVARSSQACRAFLLRRFAFDHACCLPPCAKQDGLRYLAFLFRRVEIANSAFS